MEIIQQILNSMEVFLGIFARVTGFFMSAPILSNNNIPARMKIGFSVFLSFIIFPMVQPISQTNDHIITLLIYVGKESVTGILLGFVCYLFFSIVFLAGHIVDMELGFSMGSVINPADETEIPLMANFFYMMAALVFFATNGHHTFIMGLVNSFRILPLGGLNFNYLMIDNLISIIMSTFVLSFKIVGPVIVSIFLSNILLGILARTMPQMNVFDVGIPFKILVGLLIMFMILPLYAGVFEYVFDRMNDNLNDFIFLMIRG